PAHHYRNRARNGGGRLSQWMAWGRAGGYHVMVTADHGINDDRYHGGMLPEETTVPLFVFGRAFSLQPDLAPQQTDLCGTLCELLEVAHDKPVCRGLLAESKR
ncbi:MAG TPA: nucleotide pyrophosphatase, partial [Pantoea agglomerans]|nr:nucleotide pyrophosphatase [Pantoea agglomerans]